jgi:hypothetical protein
MIKSKEDKIINVYKVNLKGDVVDQKKIEYKQLIKDVENKQYFYNEVKEKYYKLYFDIDYHYKYSFIKNYDDYTKKIINVIIKVLYKAFVNPNILYIYGEKNTGIGVHLYFYNIVVDQKIHKYILNEIYLHFMYVENVKLKYVQQIIDYHIICNGTLRLFYFNFKNGYYYPSKEKSTYPIPNHNHNTHTNQSNNIEEYMIYSIIQTNKKNHDMLTNAFINIMQNKSMIRCLVMLPRM